MFGHDRAIIFAMKLNLLYLIFEFIVQCWEVLLHFKTNHSVFCWSLLEIKVFTHWVIQYLCLIAISSHVVIMHQRFLLPCGKLVYLFFSHNMSNVVVSALLGNMHLQWADTVFYHTQCNNNTMSKYIYNVLFNELF